MLSTSFQDHIRQFEKDDGSLPGLEEKQALLDYLNRKTTPEEAAVAYSRVVSSAQDPDGEGPDAIHLYTLIESVAQEFPETQNLLIDLLKAITNLPPPVREGQEVVSTYRERYWSDLPGFAFDLRE